MGDPLYLRQRKLNREAWALPTAAGQRAVDGSGAAHLERPRLLALAGTREKKYSTDNAFVGTPEQVTEQMAAFVDIGVDYFMLDIIGLPDPDVIGLVTEELMPEVQTL